jgi:hypothetical protein
MFCCYMYGRNESVFLKYFKQLSLRVPSSFPQDGFGLVFYFYSRVSVCERMFTQASLIRKPCMSTKGRLHQEAISGTRDYKIIWPPSSFSSSHYTQFPSSCFNALLPRIPFIHHPLILRQRHLTLPDLAPCSSRTGPTAKPIGLCQGHYLLQ